MKNYFFIFLLIFISQMLIGCGAFLEEDDYVVCDLSDISNNIIPAARAESGNNIEDIIFSFLRFSTVATFGVWRIIFGGTAPHHISSGDSHWREEPLVVENNDSTS